MDTRHVDGVISVDVNYLWIQDTLMESFLLINEADGRRRLSVVVVISFVAVVVVVVVNVREVHCTVPAGQDIRYYYHSF